MSVSLPRQNTTKKRQLYKSYKHRYKNAMQTYFSINMLQQEIFKPNFSASILALSRKSISNYINLDPSSTYKIVRVILIDANNRAYLTSRPINKILCYRVLFTMMQWPNLKKSVF